MCTLSTDVQHSITRLDPIWPICDPMNEPDLLQICYMSNFGGAVYLVETPLIRPIHHGRHTQAPGRKLFRKLFGHDGWVLRVAVKVT